MIGIGLVLIAVGFSVYNSAQALADWQYVRSLALVQRADPMTRLIAKAHLRSQILTTLTIATILWLRLTNGQQPFDFSFGTLGRILLIVWLLALSILDARDYRRAARL